MGNGRIKQQSRLSITVIAIAAVMLVGATTEMSITGYVFAYNRDQAKSDVNECGNGQVPTNIGCQNIDSQIQGDENTVALAAQQTFPAEEVTPIPPPPPPEEDVCQEVEGTVWDITLLEQFAVSPPGTVLCLPVADFGVEQFATFVPPPSDPNIPNPLDVTVSALEGGMCPLPSADVEAEVTSGTPPAGVALGDTVCVRSGEG